MNGVDIRTPKTPDDGVLPLFSNPRNNFLLVGEHRQASDGDIVSPRLLRATSQAFAMVGLGFRVTGESDLLTTVPDVNKQVYLEEVVRSLKGSNQFWHQILLQNDFKEKIPHRDHGGRNARVVTKRVEDVQGSRVVLLKSELRATLHQCRPVGLAGGQVINGGGNLEKMTPTQEGVPLLHFVLSGNGGFRIF